MSFSLSELNDLTPEIEARCRKLAQDWKIVDSKPFQPPRADAAVAHFPGGQGGVNWGGAAFDPARGYYIINITNLASPAQLAERQSGSWGLAYGYRYFWDRATRIPCQRPPWGELVAVDVSTGAIAWRSTLGVTDSLPEGLRETGRPSAGGVIATASGLIFVGATDDRRLRAFDSTSGRLLWERQLPASIYATPMTYRGRSGRQFVAVVATGGMTGSDVTDDEVIVFALPTKAQRQQGASEPTIGLSQAERARPSGTVDSGDNTFKAPLPGAALDLLNQRCTSCHPATQVFSAQRRSANEWLKTVRRMEERGAQLTSQEEHTISDYLGHNFGVGDVEDSDR
jgi:quinoprotein glucose dehydrogenase